MKEIYFDNSATARPIPEVIDAITNTLKKNYGNPSSLHRKGIKANKIIKNTKNLLAEKLGVSAQEIIFTSGGTEANNLAIQGITRKYKNRGKHIITTTIEHPAVLNIYNMLENKGFEVTYLQPDNKGVISLKKLKSALRSDTILVSIMHVNNELGSIQPIEKAAKLIKDQNKLCFFHVDAVQSFGKLNIDASDWKIDLISLSAHKIHGPKGIGALYTKKDLKIPPIFFGGGQEGGLRSGTENTSGIAGFASAIKQLPELNKHNNIDTKIKNLRDYFLNQLKKQKDRLPDFQINTVPEIAAPQIINISFPGFQGEVIVHSLEREGIYISTGSACHSSKKERSNTLSAIGLSDEALAGTIRISLSRLNTKEEIDYTIEKLIEQLQFLNI